MYTIFVPAFKKNYHRVRSHHHISYHEKCITHLVRMQSEKLVKFLVFENKAKMK